MQADILQDIDKAITSGDAMLHKIFCEIDGEVHDINVIFIMKQKAAGAKTEKSGPRTNKKGMSGFGR